jgi:rhamnose transport system substrate-binding protein
MAGHVTAGSVKSFAIWNPIDLGYATVQIAAQMARGQAAGPGATLNTGRMGSVSFGADGVGAMSKPFTYDASNVAEFARIF